MSLRNEHLEKLYAFKNKDVTSLKTHDIEGARPKKLTNERRMAPDSHYEEFGYHQQGKALPVSNLADNSLGRDRFLREDEYRRKRNPMHYSDSNMYEDRAQSNILTHNEYVNQKNARDGSVRQSLNLPSMQVRDYKDVRMSYQAPLNDYKNNYSDSLQQFEQEHSQGRFGNIPVPKGVSKSSAKVKNPPNIFDEDEVSLKKNYANFYAVDNPEDKKHIYYNMSKDEITQPLNGQPQNINLQRNQPDEHEELVKNAASQNALFKRNLDNFYDDARETPENFIRNFNSFFGGDDQENSITNKVKPLPNKKTDVYAYNFITHKNKYIYTTDAQRIKKKEHHYDKFANDKNFKKNMANFFGVENEFPRPDYDKIGPAKHEDDMTSVLQVGAFLIKLANRAYGSTKPFYF